MKYNGIENELLKSVGLNTVKLKYMMIEEFKDELKNSKLTLNGIEILEMIREHEMDQANEILKEIEELEIKSVIY